MRRAGQLAVAVAVAGALLFLVGVSNPPIPRAISTDRLGPENGESVAAYLDRSRESHAAAAGSDPHWGLVSFDRAVDIDRVRAMADSMRKSQVFFRVPLDRVQTPVVSVAVGASDAALVRASESAAQQLRRRVGPDERARRILDHSSRRLSAGCECVVGVLVRGESEALIAVSGDPDVRAVEILGPDVPYGQFAVRPLLPEHRGVVAPGPDDGPVPTG